MEISIENTRNLYNTYYRMRPLGRVIFEIFVKSFRSCIGDAIILIWGWVYSVRRILRKKNTRRASDGYDGHGATETVHPLTVSASRSSSSVAAVRYGGGSVRCMAPSSRRVVFGWWRRRSVAGRPRYTAMPINIIHCARQRSFDTAHYVILLLFIVYRLLYYYYTLALLYFIATKHYIIIIYAQNR